MEKEKIYALRKEYEESGLKIGEFAELKSIKESTMRYRLRLALKYGYPSTRVRFQRIKMEPQPQPLSPSNKLIIRTSYGSVIEIPV